MAILGRSPKTRIFRNSAKGRPREVFQKSPKKQRSLQKANSTLAQMSLPSKLYPLIMQRLKKILAQKAAPKLPEWPSYGNFRTVTQDQEKFFKNRPKRSPRLKGLKALWRKWHYPLISMRIQCKHQRRFWGKRQLQKWWNGKVMEILARSPKTRIL